MEFTTLGRTNLRASVIGLGGGGPSRLGRSAKISDEESIRVVRRALELGINTIDTAESYGTEEIIGAAIQDVPRESLILATKKGTWGPGRERLSEQDLVAGLEASLRRLRTDYIDVYQLHAVLPEVYPEVRDHLIPLLTKLRDQGKIRFLGITEMFHADSSHQMLEQAVRDDCWDTIMVGFNLLNQSARRVVFPAAREKNIGTLIMFAVRRALSRPERLREVLAELAADELIDPALAEQDATLDFLIHKAGAVSVPDAAYRYCRHEPGANVILSGTGNAQHLEANAASLCRPELPAADRARLAEMFARVDNVSGS
ncbi:aldo/keto reductase [Candidatus Sumerlaeota bacterium]